MPVYQYRGYKADGGAATGIVDAESPKVARLKLRKDGVFPTEMLEQEGATRGMTSRSEPASGASLRHRSQILTVTDVALMTRQLATLLVAGLPLVDALGVLMEGRDQGFGSGADPCRTCRHSFVELFPCDGGTYLSRCGLRHHGFQGRWPGWDDHRPRPPAAPTAGPIELARSDGHGAGRCGMGSKGWEFADSASSPRDAVDLQTWWIGRKSQANPVRYERPNAYRRRAHAMIGECVGLDIGQTAIKAVRFRRRLSGRESVEYFHLPLPYGKPAQAEPARLAGQLRNFLWQNGLYGSGDIVTALPCQDLFIRTLSFPFRDLAKLDQVVPYEVENLIPMALDDVAMGSIVLPPKGPAGNGQKAKGADVLITAAPKDKVAEHLKFLAAADLKPSVVGVDGMSQEGQEAVIKAGFFPLPMNQISKTSVALGKTTVSGTVRQ